MAPARGQGVIPSFLQPLDKAVPMVATADIGKLQPDCFRKVERSSRGGTRRTATRDAERDRCRFHEARRSSGANGSGAARILGGLFKSQGMKNPIPRIRMLDGFNEGWIDFEGGEAGSQKGIVALESVLKALLEEKAHAP